MDNGHDEVWRGGIPQWGRSLGKGYGVETLDKNGVRVAKAGVNGMDVVIILTIVVIIAIVVVIVVSLLLLSSHTVAIKIVLICRCRYKFVIIDMMPRSLSSLSSLTHSFVVVIVHIISVILIVAAIIIGMRPTSPPDRAPIANTSAYLRIANLGNHKRRGGGGRVYTHCV